MLGLAKVTAGYNAVAVLHEVSLDVGPGEVVALIGANGAGKTTLLRTIVGLLRPDAGEITLDGRSLIGIHPSAGVRLGVALVPEGRRIFPTLTVEENLMVGAYCRWQAAAVKGQVDEMLTLFPRLQHHRKRQGASLSGGEQQMLAIARALMSRPRLVLLDEPSMGLAPRIVEQIFEQFAALKQRGISILLVEQNASVALEVADRGYVLELGRIALHGPAGALRENPDVRRAYLGVGADAV